MVKASEVCIFGVFHIAIVVTGACVAYNNISLANVHAHTVIMPLSSVGDSNNGVINLKILLINTPFPVSAYLFFWL